MQVSWLKIDGKWNDLGGHMIICAGYRYNDKYVSIIAPLLDPLEATKYYRYTDLLTNADFEYAQGKCTSIIVY